jgi:uncharacterized protein YbaA (DUF1428 family)
MKKARYIDGFVLTMPKKNLNAYRKMSKKAGVVFRDLGCLEYRECVGDDLKIKMGLPFPRLTKLKPGHVVIFSWVAFKSRAHRNSVNAKAMKDPRLAKMMDPKAMPFDMKKMSYGGFKIFVEC